MTNRVGGALELIGLRAVILDIRQYGNSGRQIEATNAKIGKATTDAADKSVKAAARITAAQAATAQSAQIAARAQQAAALAASTRGTPQYAQNAAAAVAWGKAQRAAAADATKAAAESNAAIKSSVAANERLAASQEKGAVLAAQRAKLVTTTAAVAGGLAIAGIGTASLGAAAKYEDTLAKINVLTNATDEQTKQLGDEFLRMSKTLPQTPDELGASAYFALSSGIKDVDEALKVTELSAKASAIGLGESKDVARVLTATLNAYKGTGLQAAQVTDVLVAAVTEGSAEASDFAQSLGRVIPVASNLGVGFDELAATIAALTNAGLDTSEATTGVLGILNQLQKSTPDAEEALKSVGLTIGGIRQEIQDKGFVATMQHLAEAFKGNTSAIRPLLPEVRGLNAFVSAFIVQGKSASDILTTIRSSAGITDNAFDKMSKTFGFQKDLLKNQLNVALIQIGTAILPTVTEAVQDLVRWIDKNQEAIKTFTQQGLMVVIEILKDFATGIGAVIDLLSWLPANEQAIVVAVAAIGAAFAWALPGGPILKGLTIMVGLLGELSREGGFGDKTAKKLNDFFGLGHDSGAGLVPNDVRIQVNKQGSVEKAIKALYGGNQFGDEIAKQMIEGFKAEGGDPTKGVEEFDRILDKVNGTVKTTNNELPKVKRNTEEVAKADDELAKKLQKLAQEFKATGDAAGQVESFTEKLKLFGNINREMADAFNLDAVAAGNVQGADAVARAYERTSNKSFEFTKALATVAQAFQQNASVAQEIVRGLARAALDAARAAASAVLSRPTREVADLGVPLARSRLRETQIAQRVNPQIEALNRQLKSIDRASRELDRAAKQREKQRKVAEEARKRAAEQQNRLLEDQLDALKLANLQARHAFERQQEQMEDLISANKKALSDLQANFLKNNEAFQDQINKAIGQGNSGQALSLVEQQRAATRAFRGQRTGLEGQGNALLEQQKQQERTEAERQRQAELAEQQLQETQKHIKRTQEDADAMAEHADSVAEDSEAQKEALEDQRTAIQDQIDSLQAQKDAQSEQTARIQEQIAVYEAQTDVLRAMAEQADKTLLTQGEQARLIGEIIKQIQGSSQIVRDLSTVQGNLIPEVEESTRQFGLLKDVIRVVSDEGFRQKFISSGIDPAVERLKILALATDEATGKVRQNGNQQEAAGEKLYRAAAKLYDTAEAIEEAVRSAGSGGPGGFAFDTGGFTPKSGGPFAATLHPNELVLPLGDKKRVEELLKAAGTAVTGQYATVRTNEVISSMPAGAMAQIANKNQGWGSIFGDMNVQGATLEDMRVVALRTVNEAFSQAGAIAARGGSNIKLGVNGGSGMIASGSASSGIGITGGGGGAGLVAAKMRGT